MAILLPVHTDFHAIWYQLFTFLSIRPQNILSCRGFVIGRIRFTARSFCTRRVIIFIVFNINRSNNGRASLYFLMAIFYGDSQAESVFLGCSTAAFVIGVLGYEYPRPFYG